MHKIPKNFKPYLAYSASAGSGKTFALSVRYLSLLFMGESPSMILAATFTNKAAAEMRQRVVDSLRELGDPKNAAFLDAISIETGFDRSDLLKKQPDVLERFLSVRSHIVTLDSFFASILRSSSLEIDLEPDFVTKEQQHEMLEIHFLEALRREGLLASLVRLAMEIEDKRMSKIFDLMQNFYRVDPLLPEEKRMDHTVTELEKEIEVLRSAMIRALEGAGAAPRCMAQFDTDNTRQLFVKGLFERESLADHSWFAKSVNGEIERIYGELKRALSQWAEAKEALILHHLYRVYDYYKNATITNARATGVLSFDDLSYFTYRLLHESISREFLYFKIDSRFRHILLDEFQDTSTLQFLLLKPLIDEIFSGLGQSAFKSFFYVGDTKQSLYRFRGGVEELFDQVAQQYHIEIKPMDTNYRSSKNVVEQVNRWFEGTMPDYTAQKSREDAPEGYVEVVESEALIEEAVMQAKTLIGKGADINDLAFLVHTNKDGTALQEACEKEGIDTLLQTSSSLGKLPEVAALVAMVSYLFYGEEIDAQPLLERVGKHLDDVDLSWFEPTMEPLAVLDRLLRDFGCFDGDLNRLKLLEFAAGFSNISTFLEEYESSSIPVAGHTLHGAKIMTVHGSKGLEFGSVIVLDRLTRKNSDRSPLIYHYDRSLYIDAIMYRMAKREHFDNQYARIIEQRRVSEAKDHMNVLYVALTRAVNTLIVLKSPKNSTFDAVGVTPLKLGNLKIEPPVKGIGNKSETTINRRVISNYGIQETAKREEEGAEKDYHAILFGTALHYLLEMMGEFDDQSLSDGIAALRNRYGQLLGKSAVEDIRTRTDTLIHDDRFRLLLEGAEISKEQSISIDGELRQIDLLLAYEDHYLVVDYKSSEKYADKHQKQVSYYCRAIEKLTGMRAEGLILYILEDKIRYKSLK